MNRESAKQDFSHKSTNEEIRSRFDKDVERFSNLDTGQKSTIDAPVSLELITGAAKAVNPEATDLLDIGCGAGNYTLKMLSRIPDLNCSLVDLSLPMLRRAEERIRPNTGGRIETFYGDIRDARFSDGQFDIVLAGAVMHHLRDDSDWESVFEKVYRILKPGGSFWISDLVAHDSGKIHTFFWKEYGRYLEQIGGADYRQNVFEYIEKEDSPRSVTYQMELLRKTGFGEVEILHKNGCFAAFGAIK
ncbi:class I SAM-dependent methyltransferase [Sinomicrobium soli]|uniref:class I SAM-dependent methyltransferase n=1 Tax=Sinomicrobium sp. N-1-3-6 TaxID=2219864 RepID=UPI000DCE718E|nr:class I SAM-dependent methyltransferase [Sinomicrobium sp. N-1-3-6]RAV29267.1 class I SAM-dependent methyltransferase [Sinomicrobium sp. N-1-3-6]